MPTPICTVHLTRAAVTAGCTTYVASQVKSKYYVLYRKLHEAWVVAGCVLNIAT
ncbi:hypothetical protein PISMIDRAFT_672818 [Pisolithus microcarpus 441]|uniref:Uncharacterized protein n=1 Tax=Pisolithus microcarpus 441 TaxID=765257 RepID=A0A0C9ZTS3_9AGAM|nr:hypothetical protein PISMIDRAFT_672818 [Pisolithus microcarpus 441]